MNKMNNIYSSDQVYTQQLTNTWVKENILQF